MSAESVQNAEKLSIIDLTEGACNMAKVILLKVLLFPVKLAFLIIAYMLKCILYILAFLINFIFNILEAMQSILKVVLLIIALCGTIVMVVCIKNNTITLFDGIIVIALVWLIAIAFSLLIKLGNSIVDFIDDICDRISDLVARFVFGKTAESQVINKAEIDIKYMQEISKLINYLSENNLKSESDIENKATEKHNDRMV